MLSQANIKIPPRQVKAKHPASKYCLKKLTEPFDA